MAEAFVICMETACAIDAAEMAALDAILSDIQERGE
jgi:hypothetical protein